MKPEERKSVKSELDAYIYLRKKLEVLAAQINRAAIKKKQQREAREMELLEYKTEEDIQDAYGYDSITESERIRLLARLEGAQEKAAAPTKEDMALAELRHMIGNLDRVAHELKYELMTEKEKRVHDENVSAWKQKIAELRVKQGKGAI